MAEQLTLGSSPVSSLQSEKTQATPTSAVFGDKTLHSPVTESDNSSWRPPEIWSTPRPPLSAIWAYARKAPWTTSEGPLRKAGQIEAVVLVMPVIAIGYYLLWLWERPSRRYFALITGLVLYLAL